MGRLDGKVALITGAAQGIGRAGAELFALEGARVAVVDIRDGDGERLVQEIRAKTGSDAIYIHADVSSGAEVREAIAEVRRRWGRLDVLYNNASVYLPGQDGRITDIDDEVWERVISINLRSIFLFCKHGIPLMVEGGGGSVINTASSAGIIGIPGCDAYTATKGATVALTRSLASEYGPLKVRANCIAPAGIRTPMLSQSNLADSTFDEEHFLGLRTPSRRYGTPGEVAQVAAFLASDESSYINGAVIVADGGITINGDLSKPSAGI
jgi:NAD(P)-dependent dehydrogenase (short-subunit alcohol dehydrogenase family)